MILSNSRIATKALVPTSLAEFEDFFSTSLFEFGERAVTIGFLARVVLGLFLIAVLARVTRNWLVPKLFRRTQVDEGVQHATARIVGYCIWVIGALVGLPLLGIPLNSVVIAFSALGVGLGFGLQNIADNFVSGLILLLERPVKLGDRIQVGDVFGRVQEIRARSTVVETNENLSILVPNSELISKNVTNLTHNGPMTRFRFPVGVAYGSDVDEVKDALEGVAKAHPAILDKPAPEALFMAFGDSSLEFILRAAAREATHLPDVLTSDVNFAIWHELKKRGIKIPFPQRDLHLRSVDAGAASALARVSGA